MEENCHKSAPLQDQEREQLLKRLQEAETIITKVKEEQMNYINELKKRIILNDNEYKQTKEQNQKLLQELSDVTEVKGLYRNMHRYKKSNKPLKECIMSLNWKCKMK